MQDALSRPPAQYDEWVYSREARAYRGRVFSEEWSWLSRTDWKVVPVWLVVAAYLFPGVQYWMVVLGAAMCLWPFVEEMMHRHVFHMKPTTQMTQMLHFALHGIHHAAPTDLQHLVLPYTASAPLAVLFYCAFRVATFGNAALCNALMCGFLLGYVRYDLTHYMLHSCSPKQLCDATAPYLPSSLLEYYAKLHRNHARHHFQNHTQKFAVSFNGVI